MGSETRTIRLPEPSKQSFDKSSSSDTKIKPITMIKTTYNPQTYAPPAQSLTPADTPNLYRRPNSDTTYWPHRITFDLKPQQYPTTSSNSHLMMNQYLRDQGVPLQSISPSQPSYIQSEYYLNRAKMLA